MCASKENKRKPGPPRGPAGTRPSAAVGVRANAPAACQVPSRARTSLSGQRHGSATAPICPCKLGPEGKRLTHRPAKATPLASLLLHHQRDTVPPARVKAARHFPRLDEIFMQFSIGFVSLVGSIGVRLRLQGAPHTHTVSRGMVPPPAGLTSASNNGESGTERHAALSLESTVWSKLFRRDYCGVDSSPPGGSSASSFCLYPWPLDMCHGRAGPARLAGQPLWRGRSMAYPPRPTQCYASDATGWFIAQ